MKVSGVHEIIEKDVRKQSSVSFRVKPLLCNHTG